MGNSKGIYLINLNTKKIHQFINETSTLYSLCQFKDNSKYLIGSLSSGHIVIYILKDKYYELIQKIQKPLELQSGEINKVISLSNGDLAAADRNSISIWKQKKEEKNNKIDEFEFFKEIITGNDTCNLIEVNPNILACSTYKDGLVKIFKKEIIDYKLLGTLNNIKSHGENSNAMERLNDSLFCLGGKSYMVYVISIEPIQLIQIIILDNSAFGNITSLHMSNNGFLFISYNKNIIQFKIIYDEMNNFVEMEKLEIIYNKSKRSEAFVTTDDGKIFYQIDADKTQFCLLSYKI